MKIVKRLILLFSFILFAIAFLCFFSARWYIKVYGDLGFDAILSTLLADIRGVEIGLLMDLVFKAILPAILCASLGFILLFGRYKKALVVYWQQRKRIVIFPFKKQFSAVLVLLMTSGMIFNAAKQVSLIEYIQYLSQQSTAFEFDYVDPAEVNIHFPEKKQNLIFIFLESVETTFFSIDAYGGIQDNVIPELYELAYNNVNFSNNSVVGGAMSLSGSGWTIAAMVAHTSGVPLKTPVGIGGNDYGQDSFLPGITNLSDILHENGYYQALMVGSDAAFGGRKQYYLQHGTDRVYDWYTAKEDGIIDQDYYVWWGMDDQYLFEYAKQELTSISHNNAPFAFTMLTVDTHHIGGYVCDKCRNDYSEQYENVMACSSRQVTEFVNWVRQQDFGDDTTIIICGDHPSMDNEYITNNMLPGYTRRVYNCFINAKAQSNNTKNREFCTMDMFPTTLAAIGCTIEGDRLGLGTNLFSEEPTLCEKYGVDAFNTNIMKNSDYYINHFY